MASYNDLPLYIPAKSAPKRINTGRGTEIMKGLLLNQYQASPNLIGYMSAFIQELDLLMTQTEEVYYGRFLENAVGVQLDVIGILLQQPRAISLPTDWFGFSDDGTPIPSTSGFASITSPALGGLLRDGNQGESAAQPLDDETYRKFLLAKAVVMNRDSADISLAYFVASTILGRVPSLFEIITHDTVRPNTVVNGDFEEDLEGWASSTVGTGAILEHASGDWTPNYTGGYVQIPPFTPTSSNNEITLQVKWEDSGDPSRPYGLFGGSVAGKTLWCVWRTTGWSLSGVEIWVDGVSRGSLVSGKTQSIRVRVGEGLSISRVGSNDSGSQKWEGRLWDIKMSDLDNPANSRHYPSSLDELAEPTTLVLEDTLSSKNGTLTNFTSPVWIPLSLVGGSAKLLVTPPNGDYGYAEQGLSAVEVRPRDTYNLKLDWINQADSKCSILVGTASDPSRYYDNGGVSGAGSLDVNFMPDLNEPVYLRLGSVEQNTWSSFDNVAVVNNTTVAERAVLLTLSASAVSAQEESMIQYFEKYFVPAGTTFNIRRI